MAVYLPFRLPPVCDTPRILERFDVERRSATFTRYELPSGSHAIAMVTGFLSVRPHPTTPTIELRPRNLNDLIAPIPQFALLGPDVIVYGRMNPADVFAVASHEGGDPRRPVRNVLDARRRPYLGPVGMTNWLSGTGSILVRAGDPIWGATGVGILSPFDLRMKFVDGNREYFTDPHLVLQRLYQSRVAGFHYQPSHDSGGHDNISSLFQATLPVNWPVRGPGTGVRRFRVLSDASNVDLYYPPLAAEGPIDRRLVRLGPGASAAQFWPPYPEMPGWVLRWSASIVDAPGQRLDIDRRPDRSIRIGSIDVSTLPAPFSTRTVQTVEVRVQEPADEIDNHYHIFLLSRPPTVGPEGRLAPSRTDREAAPLNLTGYYESGTSFLQINQAGSAIAVWTVGEPRGGRTVFLEGMGQYIGSSQFRVEVGENRFAESEAERGAATRENLSVAGAAINFRGMVYRRFREDARPSPAFVRWLRSRTTGSPLAQDAAAAFALADIIAPLVHQNRTDVEGHLQALDNACRDFLISPRREYATAANSAVAAAISTGLPEQRLLVRPLVMARLARVRLALQRMVNDTHWALTDTENIQGVFGLRRSSAPPPVRYSWQLTLDRAGAPSIAPAGAQPALQGRITVERLPVVGYATPFTQPYRFWGRLPPQVSLATVDTDARTSGEFTTPDVWDRADFEGLATLVFHAAGDAGSYPATLSFTGLQGALDSATGMPTSVTVVHPQVDSDVHNYYASFQAPSSDWPSVNFSLTMEPVGAAPAPLPPAPFEQPATDRSAGADFDSGQAELNDNGMNRLRQWCALNLVAIRAQSAQMTIVGSASPLGSEITNATLSLRRAQNVRTALYDILGEIPLRDVRGDGEPERAPPRSDAPRYRVVRIVIHDTTEVYQLVVQ